MRFDILAADHEQYALGLGQQAVSAKKKRKRDPRPFDKRKRLGRKESTPVARRPVGTAHGPMLRYTDAHVVVVEKPAGLTTMRHPEEAAEFGARAQRYLPPTLADLLPETLTAGRSGKRAPVYAVHRLDKDTSGLVVFARTKEAERNLGQQFRAHTIERAYLAVVRGKATPARIETYLVADRGDGRRGSTAKADEGKRAITDVRLVEAIGDFTVVECRLETGRTHQVRIHLGESGTPICGERIYDRPLHGRPVPDRSGASRLALHAASLGFKHPATGKWMTWKSPMPKDLKQLVARLRTTRAEPKRGLSL